MAALTLQPGDVFAGFEIRALRGEGGMGVLYQAYDKDLRRSVALKLLNRALTNDDEVRSHFLSEALNAARLSHPNIVTVFARGEYHDQLWIAMQYVHGTDASELLDASGTVPARRALRIIGETAEALDYAHENGVLHRDVKPANILLTHSTAKRPERVLLADFGIAKAIDDTAARTKSGILLGSFQYAAPEQGDYHVELDGRADVYALGCTFYHLLTGAPPYPGDTPVHLITAHLKDPIPSVRGHKTDVSPAIDAVLEKAMAKKRADRYATCGEFAEAAREVIEGAAKRPTKIRPQPAVDPKRMEKTVVRPGAKPLPTDPHRNMRFNPPPNWPAMPSGFTPGPGWRPDPSWSQPPYGWPLWVPDDGKSAAAGGQVPLYRIVLGHLLWVAGVGGAALFADQEDWDWEISLAFALAGLLLSVLSIATTNRRRIAAGVLVSIVAIGGVLVRYIELSRGRDYEIAAIGFVVAAWIVARGRHWPTLVVVPAAIGAFEAIGLAGSYIGVGSRTYKSSGGLTYTYDTIEGITPTGTATVVGIVVAAAWIAFFVDRFTSGRSRR